MTKKTINSLIIAVIIITIGSIVYYQKTLKPAKVAEVPAGIAVTTVDEKAYKGVMRGIFKDVDEVVNNCLDEKQNLKTTVEQTEGRLLETKAPLRSYKDLHVNLFLALKKLELCPSMSIGEHREVENSVNALAVKYAWVK